MNRTFPWLPLPEAPGLAEDAVHVLLVSVSHAVPHIYDLARALSDDELARCERFRYQRDRDCFIVTHGLLRAILGHYSGREPERLRFCCGLHGKPVLAAECGGHALRFNLSHSHELAVLAIAEGREVGVDVEHMRPGLGWQQIAEEFFSPDEAAALRSLPGERQLEAFYTCWTRKEAYLKARGDGLAFPLDQVRVSHPDEPPSLLSVGDDPAEAARWSLHDLEPVDGYVGALVVEGRPLHLCQWRWPEG